MSEFPAPIRDFVLALTLEKRLAAYLLVADDNTVSEWGGNLDAYNITEVEKNVDLDQQVYFLAGLLPLDDKNIFLPSVKIEGGVYADIYLFRGAQGTWVLLLDASPATIEQRRLQQKVHDLNLQVIALEQKDS
ncbi:MAG TPA: hypothetical protein VJ124_17220 [Pyrinomonadaceae bacterium]|nr:hypothetical protein [Pyrinomonadaceae bacterium]